PSRKAVLRIEPLRPATEQDRLRIEGERLHQRALLLWSEGSEPSQRHGLELETRAAALAHQAGDLRGEAEAHAGSGALLWQLGDLEDAGKEMTAAIELRTRLGGRAAP